MSTKADRIYTFIDALINIGSAEIKAELPDLDSAVGEEVMRRVALTICARFARTEMYIPAALEITFLGPRNQLIWDGYNHDGPGPTGARRCSLSRIDELAAEYTLTRRQVYNVIGEMRAREIAARQFQLPGIDPAA